jgi:HSP20 family protein
MPCSLQEQEVKASMDHGVLTITFPMATPELAPKRIELS